LAEALTKDIAAKRHDRILSALAGPGATGRAGMEAALTAVLLWAEDEPDLARLGLILPSRPFSYRSEVTGHAILHQHEIETVRSWAAPLTESGVIKPLPAALLHALIFGPADLIVRRWLEDASADRPTTMAAPLADAAWKAMAVDAVTARKYREKVAIPTGKADPPSDQSALDL
jgi:hypothetical protein